MADKLKLALVGCGAISQVHLNGIRQGAPEIEITAAVDTDSARAQSMASQADARAYTSLEQALVEGDFDAVDLMLPHRMHEDATIQSLAAGKHALLEKPMAPSVDACERMLAAWKRTDRVFMVAENAQYWPDVLTAKASIADGEIGEVVTGRASIFFPNILTWIVGEMRCGRVWNITTSTPIWLLPAELTTCGSTRMRN